MIIEALTKYYGIDFIAMTLTFFGLYFIGNKKRSGFLIALCGNILWVILGTLTGALGLIFANIVIIILYLRGFQKWEKEKSDK